jgi:hypothetical protein
MANGNSGRKILLKAASKCDFHASEGEGRTQLNYFQTPVLALDLKAVIVIQAGPLGAFQKRSY